MAARKAALLQVISAATDSDFLLYQTEDGRTRLEVRLVDDSVWLTQKLMAELFQKDFRTVNEHIQIIFKEGELAEESVIRKFRITAADGKNYETAHYNLDVIISVGYRVKSHRSTPKPPFNKPSLIPKRFDWAALLKLDGDALETG